MLATVALGLVVASLLVWIYLLAARGGFWLANIREDRVAPPAPAAWPAVAAIIPARDEAEHIGSTVASLLAQDYPGLLTLIVVDDQSTDGTAAAARRAAADGSRQLIVLEGKPPPAGWAGKVWAMRQGVMRAEAIVPAPDYLLLTDADIAYSQGVVRHLLALASAQQLSLTSLMVLLRCETLAEKALISGVRLLLPDALPVWLGEPRSAANGRCGWRVHADQGRGVERCRRHGCDPGRLDR